MIKVRVNWPTDMEELENKAAETLARILVKKLQPKEVDELIGVLQNEKLKISM